MNTQANLLQNTCIGFSTMEWARFAVCLSGSNWEEFSTTKDLDQTIDTLNSPFIYFWSSSHSKDFCMLLTYLLAPHETEMKIEKPTFWALDELKDI